MKKVFHLLSMGGYSGAEKIAIEIITNSKEKYESFYLSSPGEIEGILKSKEIPHLIYNNPRELLKIIKVEKPDILHCHDYKASLLGSITNVKKIISHIHNNPPFAKRINVKSIAYLVSTLRFKKVICVSQKIKEEMWFSRFLGGKISVIHNWVNTLERNWEKQEERTVDLLFLGRFSEQKNPLLFIEVVEKLSKEFPHLNSLMVGDGPLKEEAIQYINEKKLQDIIKVQGFTNRPHYYMKKSKIFLLTSSWEGFGLVLLEAMLNGAFILATPVGGVPEIIKNNENGFICNNKNEFVKFSRDILKNHIQRERFEVEMKETVNSFNMNVQIEKILKIYGEEKTNA